MSKEDIVWEIKFFLKKYSVIPYLNVKAGIKNLIKWAPLIWHDHDWDYVYLLSIMEFKLKNMAKHTEESDWRSVNDKNYIKSLKITAELCKRISENEYLETEINKYEIDDNFNIKDPKGLKGTLKRKADLRDEDVRLIGHYFRRHLIRWWT